MMAASKLSGDDAVASEAMLAVSVFTDTDDGEGDAIWLMWFAESTSRLLLEVVKSWGTFWLLCKAAFNFWQNKIQQKSLSLENWKT